MPTPEDNADADKADADVADADMADARRRRAEDLLKAVAGGADLGQETFKMSNEFTDEFTGRVKARLKRVFRR
jgi:hypothetical protein